MYRRYTSLLCYIVYIMFYLFMTCIELVKMTIEETKQGKMIIYRYIITVEPLNNGQVGALFLSTIQRLPLLGGFIVKAFKVLY